MYCTGIVGRMIEMIINLSSRVVWKRGRFIQRYKRVNNREGQRKKHEKTPTKICFHHNNDIDVYPEWSCVSGYSK